MDSSIIRGWSWRSGANCKSLTDWPETKRAWIEDGTRIWIDLLNPSPADIESLNDIISLDDAALEDALDGPERPRVDEYENYLALFFFGVLSVDKSGYFSPHKIVAFCGERFLVTIHPEPMLSVTSLHERCEKHGSVLFERGVDILLYRLMDTLVDNYLALLDHVESRVDQVESESFDIRVDDSFLRNISSIRLELMEIRRLANAQRSILAPMARGEFDYISENLSPEFRHVEEHLAHTLDLVETLRERLSATMHNYHSTLTKKTNDIIRVLTIFAAILLPLSLVASIYGMNVAVWPPADHPISFWVILTFMTVLGGSLLWFFKTREWF